MPRVESNSTKTEEIVNKILNELDGLTFQESKEILMSVNRELNHKSIVRVQEPSE